MKQAKVGVENLQVAALHFYLPLTKLDGRPLKSFAVIDVSLKTAWKTGFDITLGQKKSLCGVNEAAKPLCNNSIQFALIVQPFQMFLYFSAAPAE